MLDKILLAITNQSREKHFLRITINFIYASISPEHVQH